MSRHASVAVCVAASLSLMACGVEASLGRYAADASIAPEGGAAQDAARSDAMSAPDAGAAARADATPGGADASTELPLTEADSMFCDERGGGPGCGYCLGDSCCRELMRCVDDDACDCWLTCTRTSSAADCEAECAAPPMLWQSFADCSDAACAGACAPLG